MIYCGQRATQRYTASPGNVMLLAPEVRLAHRKMRGVGNLEQSSSFPALQDTAPPMALLSPLPPPMCQEGTAGGCLPRARLEVDEFTLQEPLLCWCPAECRESGHKNTVVL